MAEPVTGIILAGGDSRRMGRDKAHLRWGDGTLLEHVVETLRPVVDEVVVAVKDARRFCGLDANVVEDLMPDLPAAPSIALPGVAQAGAHALGGLYTGLRSARHERCFVCACDAPFLNPRFIRFLVEQADGYELVIPKTAQGFQPLHAVYAKSALGAIKEQLRSRHWDLKALVPTLRTLVVGPERIHRFDPEGLSFFNINTPEEYAKACGLQQRLIRVIEPRLIWRYCLQHMP